MWILNRELYRITPEDTTNGGDGMQMEPGCEAIDMERHDMDRTPYITIPSRQNICQP
jgi:hypothetical protein